MKRIILIAYLIGFSFINLSHAQISVNFNISAQPLWGPVGYNLANYYYLPDIETYYNVSTGQYIYLENNKWIFNNSLPSLYRGYNLYNGYKVVLNTPLPYLSFNEDKVKYKKYKGYKGKQQAIRYSNDPKYFVIKGHPKYMNRMAPRQVKKVYVKSLNDGIISGKRNEHDKRNVHNKGRGKGKH